MEAELLRSSFDSFDFGNSKDVEAQDGEVQQSRCTKHLHDFLKSRAFWFATCILVIVDVAIFFRQILAKDSRRSLQLGETTISFVFVVELGLRCFSFETSELLSCIPLVDAGVVILAFLLSVVSETGNPILLGRSIRVMLLFRGGARITRAVAKTARPQRIEMRSKGDVRGRGATQPLFLRSTPIIRDEIKRLIGNPRLDPGERDILRASLEDACLFPRQAGEDSESPSSDRSSRPKMVSTLAIDVLWRHREDANDTTSLLGLADMLRGTALYFPVRNI